MKRGRCETPAASHVDRRASPETLRRALARCVTVRADSRLAGGEIISLLLDAGDSYGDIRDATGLAKGTAFRWAKAYEEHARDPR